MKKQIVSIAMVLLMLNTGAAHAQAKSTGLGFNKGDKLLNVGIGVNSYYSGGIPLGASFETGVTDEISVGINVDYLSKSYYGYKFTAIYFGVRGAYHFNEILELKTDKVDLYGGGAVGYRSFKWRDADFLDDYGSSYGSAIYIGAFIGGKYYFNNNVGAFVELGAIGSTNARIGVAFKF